MHITKKLNGYLSTVALIAFIIGLSGCERVDRMIPEHQTAPPQPLQKSVSIGVALALTGEYAEPHGLPMKRGLDLAREEINAIGDVNLMFVSVDPQSAVEGGVAAVKDLVDQGVPVIIGIGISTHLEQAFPIAQNSGVVALSPLSAAAGLSRLGDYIFRTGLATNLLNPRGVAVTHEKLGYTKAAVIYDAADTFSTSSNEEITKALQALGVEILAVETFQTGDSDFSAQLRHIMDLAPEVVFISALSPDRVRILVEGRALGISERIDFIIPGLGVDEVQHAGDAAEGAIGFATWSNISQMPGNPVFVANYKAKYNIEPEFRAAQAYATLYILANAIKKAESTDAEAIRDALAETRDFPTILGDFSFDPNGEAMYDPIVVIAKDGELQAFE